MPVAPLEVIKSTRVSGVGNVLSLFIATRWVIPLGYWTISPYAIFSIRRNALAFVSDYPVVSLFAIFTRSAPIN